MPDRYGLKVLDQAGVEVARMGDISLLGWGGSDYTLAEGTFGFWSKREGAWLKAYVAMFYANSADKSLVFDPPGTGNSVSLTKLQVVVEEAFPFGTIKVPKGRIVTWEFFTHRAELTYRSTSGGGDGTDRTVTAVRNNTELRASLNGGAVQSYNFLSGPSTSGENTYTSVKLRATYEADMFGGTDAIRRDINATMRRIASIRMFAHEVNATPTLTLVSMTEFDAGSAVGERSTGVLADQGGGTGSDSGGYGGGGGGPV